MSTDGRLDRDGEAVPDGRDGARTSDLSAPIRRFANVLQVRGILAALCGVVALAWPETALLQAMLLTAIFLAGSGIYEMVFSARLRKANRGWPLALADGALCLGLAVLTATITAIPLRTTMILSALWLLAGGVLAGLLALALWPMRRTRVAMLGWCAVQLLLAALAAFDSSASIFTLLYVGAGYAIAFGAFQIGAGIWMRRIAVHQFEPTVQRGWLAARGR